MTEGIPKNDPLYNHYVDDRYNKVILKFNQSFGREWVVMHIILSMFIR